MILHNALHFFSRTTNIVVNSLHAQHVLVNASNGSHICLAGSGQQAHCLTYCIHSLTFGLQIFSEAETRFVYLILTCNLTLHAFFKLSLHAVSNQRLKCKAPWSGLGLMGTCTFTGHRSVQTFTISFACNKKVIVDIYMRATEFQIKNPNKS